MIAQNGPLEELSVLRLLRLKGRTTVDTLAQALAVDESEVRAIVDDAVAAGFVTGGTSLRMTPEGRSRLSELLDEERAGVDQVQLATLYGQFHTFNTRLKSAVTAWQVLESGEPNDHSDAEYDHAIAQQVVALDRDFTPLLHQFVAAAPRLGHYPARFDRAIANVQAGDLRYLVAPIIDSYHTVWFELHEDLIGLQGLTRADEAAAGRAE